MPGRTVSTFSHGNLALRHLGIPTVTGAMGIEFDIAMPVGLTFAAAAYADLEILRFAAAFEAGGSGSLRRRRRQPPAVSRNHPDLQRPGSTRSLLKHADSSMQRTLPRQFDVALGAGPTYCAWTYQAGHTSGLHITRKEPTCPTPRFPSSLTGSTAPRWRRSVAGPPPSSTPPSGSPPSRSASRTPARSFPAWRDLSLARRQTIIFRFRELLDARKGELAELITAEHGGARQDPVRRPR